MNDFKISLHGKHGVFKPGTFYKPGASVKERTFVCEDGPGCEPKVGTRWAVTGRWLDGNLAETIHAYDFEYVLDNGKKVMPKDTGDHVEAIADVVRDAPAEKPKMVRRKR